MLASVLGQIMQHPEIFVFGEFLALDSVRAAAGTKEHALLELFAYDKYEHYIGMTGVFIFVLIVIDCALQLERRLCQHSAQRKRKN